jgi:hypothetical protein
MPRRRPRGGAPAAASITCTFSYVRYPVICPGATRRGVAPTPEGGGGLIILSLKARMIISLNLAKIHFNVFHSPAILPI